MALVTAYFFMETEQVSLQPYNIQQLSFLVTEYLQYRLSCVMLTIPFNFVFPLGYVTWDRRGISLLCYPSPCGPSGGIRHRWGLPWGRRGKKVSHPLIFHNLWKNWIVNGWLYFCLFTELCVPLLYCNFSRCFLTVRNWLPPLDTWPGWWGYLPAERPWCTRRTQSTWSPPGGSGLSSLICSCYLVIKLRRY